jgi:cytochrome c oxidase subunit III
MSVVIVFVLVMIAFSSWWLLRQRVLSKPWLEVGADPVGGPGEDMMPTPKIALGVFLAVVGALFALFASAYFMRMAYADWRDVPVPPILWLNTVMLGLASVLLHCALGAARRGDGATVRLGLAGGGVATLAFLAGQVAAWDGLTASGFFLSGNPADSFFYLLTGMHGLHIAGGLVALAAVGPGLWRAAAANVPGGRARAMRPGDILRIELCVMYWHFLLFVWVGLLVLLTGWAAEVIEICRAILT